MERFEVWIICTLGTGYDWRKMSTFATRTEAEQFIRWQKEIDARFPCGQYSYKIKTVQAELNAVR